MSAGRLPLGRLRRAEGSAGGGRLGTFAPFRHGGHARRTLLRQRLKHRLDQRPDRPVDIGKIGDGPALLDDFQLGAVHIEWAAARRLGEHEAEAVNVRLEGDVAVRHAELFRRDIVVLARESAADDRPLAHAQRAGDAEVDDLGLAHVAVRQDDVVRRHIPMDDPQPVRRVESVGDPSLQDPDFGERQRPGRQAFGQRRTVDEFHRKVRPQDVGIDRNNEITDNRFVHQIVQYGGLAPEQLEHLRIVRELGEDHLDRHEVVGLNIESAINFAHASLGDQLLDFINAVEPRSRPDASGRRRLEYGPLLHRALASSIQKPNARDWRNPRPIQHQA